MEAKLGFYQTDRETILSHLKHHEQQLKLKRRWLMGLPVSISEEKLLKHKSLPESFLREDDIFYETVKKHVEDAFGVDNGEREDHIIQETKNLFDKSNLKRILLSCIDALTNEGLVHLAMLLTRRSVKFEKTRPKLKKVIRESIPGVFRDQHHNVHIEIFTQLSQLLKDPQNVRDNGLTLLIPTFHFYHVSAIKILDRLEELPSETLVAMCRKLRGAPAGTPRLQQNRHGMSRNKLICKVRRTSEEMLSELCGREELQAPLAKALALAGLSQKLSLGYSNSFLTDFNQFSPETKTLQNEITKAILLLKVKTKVRLPELKTLKLLLDPDANIPNKCLRTAMKKMLTEYLFECSDLDTIPKSLSKALAIINRSSRSTPSGCFLKDEMEEEVECILNVSAQMKQIVCDFLPYHDFDKDFANAYMEELEESDDGGDDNYDCHDINDNAFAGDTDGHQLHPRNFRRSMTYSVDSDNIEESCGEYVPMDSKPSIATPEGTHGPSLFREKGNVEGMLNVDATQFKVESMGNFGTSRISGNTLSPHLPPNQRLHGISIKGNEPEESTSVDSGTLPTSSNNCFKGENSEDTNLYIGIQEVCDETIIVAYNLIGYMMEKFAREEDLDLEWSDSSYLRGNYSSQENQEKMLTSGKNVSGSVIVEVVEKLLPSLPKSAMEKLKDLIGIP